MNRISPKIGYYIALIAILAYWAYDIFVQSQKGVPILPADFLDLTLKIYFNKILMMAAIFFLLWLESEPVQDASFSKQGFKKAFLPALGLGLAVFVVVNIILSSLTDALLPKTVDQGIDMTIYMKGLLNFLLWMPMVIFASFVEEIQRVYVMQRFEKWFGKSGLLIAIAMTTICFGIGHLYQGLGSAIGTGVGGLCYALVYLRKRSLMEACLCHALFDVVSVCIGYMIAK